MHISIKCCEYMHAMYKHALANMLYVLYEVTGCVSESDINSKLDRISCH